MFNKQVLGLKEAQVAVQAILDEAFNEPERPVAVAVVDDRTDLICMARMDGARPVNNYMAIRKACSAAETRRDTRAWRDFLQERNYDNVDFGTTPTRTLGGLCVVMPSEQHSDSGTMPILYGGIGVSGRRGDEDEALAIIGLKALQRALWG